MSTSGSVSGAGMIDVNTLVNSLMQVEQRPLQVVASRISAATTNISAMGQVRSLVDSAYSAAAAVQDSLTLSGKAVTVGDESFVKVNVTNSSQAGVGVLSVSDVVLAQAQRTTFSGFRSTTLAMGSGAGALTIGVPAASSLLGSATTLASVEINLAGKTLAEVRDAVNDHAELKTRVRASLVNTGAGSNGWVLMLTGLKTGASAHFTAAWAADDAVDGVLTSTDDGVTLGSRPTQDRSSTAGGVTTYLDGARPVPTNASAVIDGVAVQSETNVFSTAAPGLRIEALKASSAATPSTTVTVSDNRAEIQSRVKTFVTKFSDLLRKLSEFTKPGSADSKAGPLAGNSGILGLSSGLLRAYTQGITLSEGRSYTRSDGTPAVDLTGKPLPILWAQLGLNVNRDGTISLNESTLSSTLSGDLGGLLMQGFTSAVKDSLGNYRGSSGTLQLSIQTMQRSLKGLKDSQDDLQERLQRTRASLVAKYSALDARLAQMAQLSRNVQSSLSGLKV